MMQRPLYHGSLLCKRLPYLSSRVAGSKRPAIRESDLHLLQNGDASVGGFILINGLLPWHEL